MRKTEIFEFGEVQKNANLVDLEKRWKMSLLSLWSASIAPRTSRRKFRTQGEENFPTLGEIWNLGRVKIEKFQTARSRLYRHLR